MSLPDKMRAMVTMGHGGPDKVVFHDDWPCPGPGKGEVLIKVGACGLNNTDVNTRSGWYSKAVRDATTGDGHAEIDDADPTWGGGGITFPRIQGADVAGHIVAVGAGVDTGRIGARVITDNWLRDASDPGSMDKARYFGSECDGGFAEYAAIASDNALAVNSPLTDAELATFSCSYSTAEGMLTRAGAGKGDTVLVTGASGGVGGALVQLAKLRGCRVIGLASEAKHDAVMALGADLMLPRVLDNPENELAGEKITVIADVVGGMAWPRLMECLERGGRYTVSGAIAGPMVELDLRVLYLRDLTFTGSTILGPQVMRTIVDYIEREKIKPVLAASYPLEEFHAAQSAFTAKEHTGNIVVTP